MRFDHLGIIISDSSPFPGSHGDSCAETCRFIVLGGDTNTDPWIFVTHKGALRHPDLANIWDETDFSNDQMLPLLMAKRKSIYCDFILRHARLRIPGTRTIMNPAVLALYHGLIRTFGVASVIQGLILRLFPFRWNENKGFQWSSEYGADYLNLIASVAFLRRQGHNILAWLTLNAAGKSRSFRAIFKHYTANEPASELRDLVLELYRKQIFKGEKNEQDTDDV